jgi:hypothetical protein
VYLQLLLGWGEHGLPGAVCATVALSHIAAAAAILGLAKFSHDSAVFLGEPGKSDENIALHVHGNSKQASQVSELLCHLRQLDSTTAGFRLASVV